MTPKGGPVGRFFALDARPISRDNPHLSLHRDMDFLQDISYSNVNPRIASLS
jgi:hypothetical protein